MKLATDIKLPGHTPAGSPITPLEDGKPGESLLNWAGNIRFSTSNIVYPKSVEEVQVLVKQHPKVKALGTRHCFNFIADSKDFLLSTNALNEVVLLDTNAKQVTVSGGIKYGELAPYLHENGFALPNLASLPHISIAGSVATATHGSGVANGNLATAVTELELVTADGSVINLNNEKEGDEFFGAVVSLGALGVVTKVTLALQPAFQMQQYVFQNLPLSELLMNFDTIMGAGYSVSLFTDWLTDNINSVWIKQKASEQNSSLAAPEFYGAKAAVTNVHPIGGVSAENCTEQMGVPGAWFERLPHFKMGFTPSSGVELQSEYFIPDYHAVEAIQALGKLGDQIGPLLFISEVRTIAADNLWMSPCYRQSSVALHFTWKQDWPAVSKLLPLIEQELAPFQARPHWGKLFTMSPEVVRSRYDKLSDFRNLVSMYDPSGKFRNEFLDTFIFGS